MKILLVHNIYRSRGGEDVVVSRERDLLQRFGHQVISYFRSNRELEGISALVKLGRPQDLVRSAKTYNEVKQIIRTEKPDLVHVHNTSYVISPSVFAACADTKTPTVQTIHNYRMMCPGANFFREGKVCETCLCNGLLSAVRHRCCNGSFVRSALTATTLFLNRDFIGPDLYIVPSEFTRAKMAAAKIPADRIRVKPHFVDYDAAPRLVAGDYAIAVGRLSSEKGFETLVKAWRELSFPLKIVGDGPLQSRLEELAGRRPGIQLVGRKDRDEVFALLRDARFLVFPSECYETFGMVIAEAFACGVPVLCARGGAAEELVEEQVTGLHFSPADADSLAQSVRWALDRPDEMDAMGRRARKEYESRYTAQQNYSLLMNIYSELVDWSPSLGSAAEEERPSEAMLAAPALSASGANCALSKAEYA